MGADDRAAEELWIAELEGLLARKRLEARQARLMRLRQSGRILTLDLPDIDEPSSGPTPLRSESRTSAGVPLQKRRAESGERPTAPSCCLKLLRWLGSPSFSSAASNPCARSTAAPSQPWLDRCLRRQPSSKPSSCPPGTRPLPRQAVRGSMKKKSRSTCGPSPNPTPRSPSPRRVSSRQEASPSLHFGTGRLLSSRAMAGSSSRRGWPSTSEAQPRRGREYRSLCPQ